MAESSIGKMYHWVANRDPHDVAGRLVRRRRQVRTWKHKYAEQTENLRAAIAVRDARIDALTEALCEIGDYHDSGSDHYYTQNRVAEVLGPNWWEEWNDRCAAGGGDDG